MPRGFWKVLAVFVGILAALVGLALGISWAAHEMAAVFEISARLAAAALLVVYAMACCIIGAYIVTTQGTD